MSKDKQMLINLFAQLFSFIVSLGINFFLTPFIVNNVGTSAYGFVSLSNNLISYAQVITTALNSMASRFITIKIVEDDWEEANKYFTSVLWANIIISLFLLIPSIFGIVFIDKLLDIPANLLSDVRLLFILLYLNFIASIILSVFSVATFVKNKLYLTSYKTIIAYVIRIIILVISFCFFKPSIWYVGFAGFIFTLYIGMANYGYTKKLLPKLKFKKFIFDIKKLKELISSGIWNSITRLGQILLDGLDLIIANLYIGPIGMGILSISKTVPTMLLSVISTIVSVFMPDFTIEYAKGNKEELLNSVKKSMKILAIFTSIPIAILIVYGKDFFTLWVPNENAQLLHYLSLISIGVLLISGGVNCIYNIFTVVNKIKMNAILLIATGVASTIIVYILLKTTNLGLYAIVSVSTILGIIRNLCFTVPYGAKCLGLKWNVFYPDVLRTIFCVIVVSVVGVVLKMIISPTSWLLLAVSCVIVAIVGLVIEICLVLDKNEKKYFINKILRRC